MKTLIINLPRTGSTSLHTRLVSEQKAIGVFNPFDGTERTKILWDKNIVVKSGIPYPPDMDLNERIQFYMDLIPKFDKVILLSRKDNYDHLLSYMHFLLNNTEEAFKSSLKGDFSKFNSQAKYVLDEENFTEELREEAQTDIRLWNKALSILSKKFDIPITYYEDIFDINSKDRYRQTTKVNLI